jgi:hypothetical protein
VVRSGQTDQWVTLKFPTERLPILHPDAHNPGSPNSLAASCPSTPIAPEFRPLAPWPPGTRFLDGRTERILQNQLPPRPDARSYTGSSAALTADSAFAERSVGESDPAESLAKDAARQRQKRTAAAVG